MGSWVREVSGPVDKGAGAERMDWARREAWVALESLGWRWGGFGMVVDWGSTWLVILRRRGKSNVSFVPVNEALMYFSRGRRSRSRWTARSTSVRMTL